MTLEWENQGPNQCRIYNLSAFIWRVVGAFFFVLYASVGFTINADQWQIENLKVDHGLPSSTIYSIAQDHSGFVWFGTTRGLARYDGYTFKTIKHDTSDTDSISNDNAGNIFVDSNNNLWIGTFGGGVNKLELTTGQLTRYPYSNDQIETKVSENVQTFYEDSKGSIWIGTATGLYQYNKGKIKHFDPRKTNLNGEEYTRVWDIVSDEPDTLWIGTSDGLYEFNKNTEKFTQYKLPANITVDITSNQFRKLLLKKNKVWIGSSSGLFSFNKLDKSFQFHSPPEKTIKINDIYSTSSGSLLIASMEGLYLFEPQTEKFVLDIDGAYWQHLSYVDVRYIHVDQSGIMWLATRDSGIYKVDMAGGLFKYHSKYLPKSQLNEKVKQVWAIEATASGSLMLGTSETLFLNQQNDAFNRTYTEGDDSIPGIIRDIEVNDDLSVWVGSSQGLFYIPENSFTAEEVSAPFDLLGMEPADVFSVEITSNGEIWLALYNLGVLRWQPEKNKAELIQNQDGENLTDLNINHVFQDSKSNIWISSNLIGLFKFNPDLERLKLYYHDFNNSGSISSNRVNDVFEDTDGRLWVATARGLNQYSYQQDKFIRVSHTDEIVNETIKFILEDSQQNLWIGHKFGLYRFNPHHNEINSYLLNAAIKHDGFVPRAASIDKNDILYLGSANGFYTFNPEDHKSLRNYMPPLIINGVKVDDIPIQKNNLEYTQKQYKLDYKEQRITFDFSVLDYKTPEQIQYFYQVKGLHEEWINVSSRRHVNLNGLNPGNYQLTIKAINNDGRWEEQKLVLDILVKPVWWSHDWIKVVAAMLILLMGFVLHNYRTYKIRKQNLLLEKQVNKRTIELQNLNERLELAANSDFLTGLPNRMSFISAYEEKQKQQQANSLNSCIVLADVDHFKKVNDRFGHCAGDHILIQLSLIMKKLIRDQDLIARWGGEEFIFYFNNKDAQETVLLVERIRKEVAASELSYQGQNIPVTMTFGVCQRIPGMTLIDCINAADESMYQGKSEGRNAVVLSQVPKPN